MLKNCALVSAQQVGYQFTWGETEPFASIFVIISVYYKNFGEFWKFWHTVC